MENKLIKKTINTARGIEKADLVLKNVNLVNVLTKEIYKTDIAITNGIIVGLGHYHGLGKHELDLDGKYACPGLIDAHVHIESSMVTPSLFAHAILPTGATTVITDPHEIANVSGIEGIEFMQSQSQGLPVDIHFMIPSCVPATPFETSGAILEAKDIEPFSKKKNVLGLAEVMNFPGILNLDPSLLKKIRLFRNKNIDGHAPGLTEKNLCAYTSLGIKTDHECTTQEELIEKARLGMYIAVREGSSAKNLEPLLSSLDRKYYNRCMLCTDDIHIEDIRTLGYIDNCVRKAIQIGVDPIEAISMATINTATCYGLKNKGTIAPGYIADIVIFDNVKNFNIEMVFKNGKLCAKDKQCTIKINKPTLDKNVLETVIIPNLTEKDISLPINNNIAKVIGIIPGNLITKASEKKVHTENGNFIYNPKEDVVKVVVVERHGKTGNIGIGLLGNFGVKNGAIAMSIGHDSHNIIASGSNDEDILNAIKELKKLGGGICISSGGKIEGTLALPVCGLMSHENLDSVCSQLKHLLDVAHNKLQIPRNISPFNILSFVPLPVIPEIRLTDKGLFDVTKFEFIKI